MKNNNLNPASEKHRWSLNYGDTPEKETPEYWDKKAKHFAQSVHSQSNKKSVIDFLNRFSWSPNDRVLDIASGPGTYSIPLAKMVASITAIDFSSQMLEEFKKYAKDENITNISFVKQHWLDFESKDKFDTVLCLNALGVASIASNGEPCLAETINKLVTLTKKRLVITIPHATSVLPATLREQLNLSVASLESRRIATLYAMLVDLGALPEVTYIKHFSTKCFPDDQSAHKYILTMAGAELENKPELKGSANTSDIINEYLNKNLKKDNEKVCLDIVSKQALLVWVCD